MTELNKDLTTGDVAMDARISALVPYILKRTITAYPLLGVESSPIKLSDKAQSALNIIKRTDSFGCRTKDVGELVSVLLGENIVPYIATGSGPQLKPVAWTVLTLTDAAVTSARTLGHNYSKTGPVLIDQESASSYNFGYMLKADGARGNTIGSSAMFYQFPTEDEVRQSLFTNWLKIKPLFDMIDVAQSVAPTPTAAPTPAPADIAAA